MIRLRKFAAVLYLVLAAVFALLPPHTATDYFNAVPCAALAVWLWRDNS